MKDINSRTTQIFTPNSFQKTWSISRIEQILVNIRPSFVLSLRFAGLSIFLLILISLNGLASCAGQELPVNEREIEAKISKEIESLIKSTYKATKFRMGQVTCRNDRGLMFALLGMCDMTNAGGSYPNRPFLGLVYIVNGKPILDSLVYSEQIVLSPKIDTISFLNDHATQYRMWKTSSGKYSVKAKLVSREGESITLQRHDNKKEVVVRIELLSDQCKSWLDDFASGKVAIHDQLIIEGLDRDLELTRNLLKQDKDRFRKDKKLVDQLNREARVLGLPKESYNIFLQESIKESEAEIRAMLKRKKEILSEYENILLHE